MNTQHDDEVDYYVKKYRIDEMVNQFLALAHNEWYSALLSNPVMHSEHVVEYLRRSRRKMEAAFKNLTVDRTHADALIERIISFEKLVESVITSGERSDDESLTPSDNYQTSTQCTACAGTGTITCSSCGGYGYHTSGYTRTNRDGSSEYVNNNTPCSFCSGGRLQCRVCGGSGRVF